jgi:FemAB-related protein (PEP-CTERM system-associated)
MEVRRLESDGKEHARWDQYVMQHEQATHYHLSGWGRVIQKTYGQRALYMLAEEAGTIRGILPLIVMKSFLRGRSLTSLPFLDYGGICAEDAYAKKQLLAAALSYGEQERIQLLDLRHQSRSGLDLHQFAKKVTLILPLEHDPDRMWKTLHAKVKNQIRKAMKSSLTVQWCGLEGLKDFYHIYATNMRDLGSPAHSRYFFQAILEEFTSTKLVLVLLNSQVIGGGVCLFFRDTILVPWASSLRTFFPYCPNNLLYWEAMRVACERGYRQFDFGRSSYGSGTYHFKKQWGAVERPLCWEYWAKTQHAQPIIQTEDARYNMVVRLWQKIPVPLTKLLGPFIRKQLSN